MKIIYHRMLFLTLFHANNFFIVKTSAMKYETYRLKNSAQIVMLQMIS